MEPFYRPSASSDGRRSVAPVRARHALVVTGYLLAALWVTRAVLPAPATLLAYPAFLDGSQLRGIYRIDHMNEASAMLRSAAMWLRAPRRLLEGDCFPVPHAATLGEHMMGEGLAAAIPLALSGEPILAYNFVVILWLVIAGVAMYALAFHWTGSSGAAFVAGLVFALHPVRAGDPQHLFIHADHWIPLVLLFLHRLLLHGRWRDVALLTGAVSLLLLESAYNVLEAALIVGVCGFAMLVHRRHHLVALLPKLGVATGAALAVAGIVFGPFARTFAVWPPSAHISSPLPFAEFFAGGTVFPGWVALSLVALALLDRLWTRNRGEDPRLPMLCAGLVCFWAVAPAIPIPWDGSIPSPLLQLRILRGLRALHLISQGVPLASAFLAAFGVTTLMRLLPRLARPAVPALVIIVALAQVLVPALARPTFGPATLEMSTSEMRPPQPLIDLFGKLPQGPVLDLPFSDPRSWVSVLGHVPHYALMRTFHQRRIAACSTSLRGGAEPDVGALGARLPGDPRAVDALYALGFRSVIVHGEFLLPKSRAAWEAAALMSPEGGPRLRMLGRAEAHLAFALASPVPIATTFAALGPSATPQAALGLEQPEAVLPFTIRNLGSATYRHPDPVEPTAVVVRWRGSDVDQSSSARLLLPLALASGEEIVRSLTVPTPGAPGRYEVTLELEERVGTVLARLSAEVKAPAGPGTQ
jgi:hypothetical protein